VKKDGRCCIFLIPQIISIFSLQIIQNWKLYGYNILRGRNLQPVTPKTLQRLQLKSGRLICLALFIPPTWCRTAKPLCTSTISTARKRTKALPACRHLKNLRMSCMPAGWRLSRYCCCWRWWQVAAIFFNWIQKGLAVRQLRLDLYKIVVPLFEQHGQKCVHFSIHK